jgi:hypothetical protein
MNPKHFFFSILNLSYMVNETPSSFNIAEAMDALEAEAEAIMEMVGRRGNQLQSQSSSEAPELSGAESNVDGTPGALPLILTKTCTSLSNYIIIIILL